MFMDGRNIKEQNLPGAGILSLLAAQDIFSRKRKWASV